MVDIAVKRESALEGHYLTGHYGSGQSADAGVVMQQVPDLVLWQVAAWPDTLSAVAGRLEAITGVAAAPGFTLAAGDESTALLRIEPLKFWVYGGVPQSSDADESVVLDLSHSRTQLRITGQRATTLLNGFLPLDLRESAFPVNSVASTAFHHVGVTLWRSPAGYELFLPRGFALSLWQLLQESAMQYGLSIK